MGTVHTPTSIPPAPDEELDDAADDADDADDVAEVDEGPPEDELTPMPPVAPIPPLPGPPPPAPPEFVPPDPFVVPDGSLRGPVAEQATMTNDDSTEAVRSRVACFTKRGSAELIEVSSLCGGLCHDAARALLGQMSVMKFVIVLAIGAIVTGCVKDEPSDEDSCDRRAFACVNGCYKAGQGAACRTCCQENGKACKKNESFGFYSCLDKDDP